MKVAVLPLNAAEGSRPALGRQFSNLIAESVRNTTGADVQSISYLANFEEDGVTRAAYVNVGGTMPEYEFFKPLFEEGQVDRVLYGVLSEEDGQFVVQIRSSAKETEEPIFETELRFAPAQLFDTILQMTKILADVASIPLPEDAASQLTIGTANPDAFLLFMEGYDGFQYIQQTNGAVAKEFVPKLATDSLLAAVDLDPTFRAPFDTAIQFCRLCIQHRLGSFEDSEAVLTKLSELAPNDFRPYAAIAEMHQSVGNIPKAAELYDKALSVHLQLGEEIDAAQTQERAAMYTRLGSTQMAMGMPVNAERNFRKAVELEEPDKPTLDLLANVLAQTNRGHEIPIMWREEVARNPQSGPARARLGAALIESGQHDEGVAIFESALEELEDNTFIKRVYAPVLAQTSELDRSMDFYEDCLDVAPNDIPLMIEYANVLKAADREFEIPQVLKNILASNPDPNTRAQTLAWLIEIEQPKRVEAVEDARKKLEAEDAEGAVRDLKPLRNWLADYYKLWALLSNAYNRLNMAEEAEDAAQRLLNLFPGYEPGYGELVSALSSLGRAEEAYNVMRYAVTNVPNSLGVHLNLALAAKRAGHEDEARSIARQIRAAVGPNEELEPVLAEIEA